MDQQTPEDRPHKQVDVPLNDPKRRFVPKMGELVEEFSQFLERGVYVGGADVREFEERFAAWCGREFCVAVANGTDALELAARAVDVSAGDEVICVANAGGYVSQGRHGQHSEHMGFLLAEMQSLQRAYPGGVW